MKIFNNVTRLLILFLFGLSPFFSYPHFEGHFAPNNYYNTWHLTNGTAVKGNFLFGDQEHIVLEQSGGRSISVPLQNLTSDDQRLAKFKIKKYEATVSMYNAPQLSKPSQEWVKNYHWFILSIIAALSFIIVFRFNNNTSASKKLFGVTLFSFFILSYTTITESNKRNNTQLLEVSFAPYKSYLKTKTDNIYYHVSSDGLPRHPMMIGIRSWQQQVPLPQEYTGQNDWSIPLEPEISNDPISTKNNFMRGAIALAVNGVPIFNALNNRGEDANKVGELDKWGGHCGRGDDYHYHIAPLHLTAISGDLPIAFALDGFPIYGTHEPDGSKMQPLDNYHGHSLANGLYHYHGTEQYPYTIGAFRGKVNIDPNLVAPENQIIPQAFARPIRQPGRPLKGATITNFESNPDQFNILTYEQDGKKGLLYYRMDEKRNLQMKHIHPDGSQDSSYYPARR
jgi:hypothetical protein